MKKSLSEPEFSPAPFLRRPYVQTILASSRVRRPRHNPMIDHEKETILESSEGIRLQGFFSRPNRAKGIVILIHGWEGSATSTYILSTGNYLFERNYAIFRLNLRDHGESHHLNTGLFWALILDEVFEAVQQAAQMERGAPAFLVGFSLGGNFALRIAQRCERTPVPQLKHIIAVSPGLNPSRSTDAIDQAPLLKWYFLKKWKNSLKKKERLFPNRYRFNDLLKKKSVREMTALVLERYSSYGEIEGYFRGYDLTGGSLKNLSIPTTLITAEDDPIIPVHDFHGLHLSPSTRMIVHRFGGHNGFIETIPFRCWYETHIHRILEQAIVV